MRSPLRRLPLDVVEEDWTAKDLAQLRPTPDSIAEFQAAFSMTAGIAGKLWFTSSGREGLRSLLAALPRDPDRTDVLMSAFNCPVVPAAVRTAGYRPVFYDFATSRGEVDWSGVASRIDSRVAAVLVSHFFGAPADAEPIRDRARHAGVHVIEDCAHAIGGSLRGIPVGSLWDAAIFSFNYGKPISLGGGAAVVLNSDALRDITLPVVRVEEALERREIAAYLKSVTAGRSAVAPVPVTVEFGRRVGRRLGLMTPVTPPLARGVGPLRAELGILCLSRWPGTQGARNANAAFMASRGIPLWNLPEGALPSWLRLRLTLQDRRAVKAASRRLRDRGFRAGNLNWSTVDPRADDLPWAERAAAYGIDAPIHQNMTVDDLASVAEVLGSYSVEDGKGPQASGGC